VRPLRPVVAHKAERFCYRLTHDQVPGKLQAVGEVLLRLKAELTIYGDEPAYQLLLSVLTEHFELVLTTATTAASLHTKPPQEVGAASLQSPDDQEATYRTTDQGHLVGYKANAAEICAPENPFQLITSIQVAPNLADDQDLMAEALPGLIERAGLTKLWTDGGFTGAKADRTLAQYKLEQVPTALRGEAGAEGKLAWQDFTWQVDAIYEPVP
jgi:hypothetical protein